LRPGGQPTHFSAIAIGREAWRHLHGQAGGDAGCQHRQQQFFNGVAVQVVTSFAGLFVVARG